MYVGCGRVRTIKLDERLDVIRVRCVQRLRVLLVVFVVIWYGRYAQRFTHDNKDLIHDIWMVGWSSFKGVTHTHTHTQTLTHRPAIRHNANMFEKYAPSSLCRGGGAGPWDGRWWGLGVQ